MEIKIGLETGTDLKSLKHQAGIIKSNLSLGAESFNGNPLNQMNPFLEFVGRVKLNLLDTFKTLPDIGKVTFNPSYTDMERIGKSSYFNLRNLNVACVPETNAQMKNYLEYLSGWGDVAIGVANYTIPDMKRFFSAILEDVGNLEGMSIAAGISSVSLHKEAIGILKEKYMGIIKSKPQQIETRPFGQQYSSMQDYKECQEKAKEILLILNKINVDKTTRAVNEMNDIVSKVIVRVKQNKDLVISEQNIKAITELLYNVAEEVSYMGTFCVEVSNLAHILEEQMDVLKEFTI